MLVDILVAFSVFGCTACSIQRTYWNPHAVKEAGIDMVSPPCMIGET